MNYLFRSLFLFLIFATCRVAILASQGPLLLENPTVSRTKIAFSHAGDIWVVDRSGGNAQRLTTHEAREVYPVFSPDGSQVAFARFNPAAGPFGDARNGTWFMENRGVMPDYELEIMPPAWRAGRDPQLEKAVALAMDALKKMKPVPIKRPAYPVYK